MLSTGLHPCLMKAINPSYAPGIKEENKKFVKLGDIGEDKFDFEIREYIQRETGETLHKLSNSTTFKHWRNFDWGSQFSKAELKYRPELIYKKFGTTMIGYNKIQKGLNQIEKGCRVFFFFGFKDGLFVWELTQDNHKTDGNALNYEEYWGKPYEKPDYYTPFDPLKKNYYLDIKKLIKV